MTTLSGIGLRVEKITAEEWATIEETLRREHLILVEAIAVDERFGLRMFEIVYEGSCGDAKNGFIVLGYHHAGREWPRVFCNGWEANILPFDLAFTYLVGRLAGLEAKKGHLSIKIGER